MFGEIPMGNSMEMSFEVDFIEISWDSKKDIIDGCFMDVFKSFVFCVQWSSLQKTAQLIGILHTSQLFDPFGSFRRS